mmetsp:Transcript_5110/g.11954  ORF Transcript_5110/g.11954 Transcript_5110/m.11954 type:complete len:271 (-) Transcript_5110:775-1587(-)
MLPHRKQNTVNTKRRLDHRWDVRLCVLLHGHLLDIRDMLGQKSDSGLAIHNALQRALRPNVFNQFLKLLVIHLVHPLLHGLPLLLESLHDTDLTLLGELPSLVDQRGIDAFFHRKVHLGCGRMGVQVKARSVRNPNTFQPTVAALNLCVPAIAGVVRHLSWQMLTKPQMLLLDPDAPKEQIGAANHVPEGFIVNHTLRHCVSQRQPDGLLGVKLLSNWKQSQHQRRYLLELGVVLLRGLHEPLDFTLRKLSHSCESSSGCNLVSEHLPNL